MSNQDRPTFPQTLDTPDKPKGAAEDSSTVAPSDGKQPVPVSKTTKGTSRPTFPQTSSVPQRSGETEQSSTVDNPDYDDPTKEKHPYLHAITNLITHPVKSVEQAHGVYKNVSEQTGKEGNLSDEAVQEKGEGPISSATYVERQLIHPTPSTVKRAGAALGDVALTPIDLAQSVYHAVAEPPKNEEEAAIESGGSVTQPGSGRAALAIKRLLYDPQAAEAAKAREEAEQGHGVESFGHSVAAGVPLIGPMTSQLGEEAGKGDVAGAVTKGAAYAAIPKIAKEAMPGGKLPGAAAKGESAFPTVGKVADITSDMVGKAADIANKAKTPVGKILTDEAKQYALRKIPGYDVIKTAKKIANKISDLKEAENASALSKPADELIPSRAAKTATDPNMVGNSYIPSRSAKPARLKTILPEEPTTESALKPIGTKPTAEPASEPKPIGQVAPEESAEVRQARHVLGNVAVDKLKTEEAGPEALRRLTKGTYQQYADLANALDIKKPAYLAEKNGEAWQASEFKRTVKEHGRSLSGPKETVVRELLSKPPAEILQHTNPWVDSTAKYPAQMSSLTERTMKALGLTEEAKNNLRASGVSDAQAQSLLAKLTKRQLENLSETMEKGEHLPTVSGGSQGADLSPNASGESSASLENINRVASQKAKGVKTYRLNSLSGQATPILAQDAVDWRPGPAEHKIEVDGEGNISVLESGSRAHPVMKSSKIRFPQF